MDEQSNDPSIEVKTLSLQMASVRQRDTVTNPPPKQARNAVQSLFFAQAMSRATMVGSATSYGVPPSHPMRPMESTHELGVNTLGGIAKPAWADEHEVAMAQARST